MEYLVERNAKTFPLKETLYDWFVRYNPLYFASAMLVLAGAWQLSRGLAEAGAINGRIIPLGLLEAYQFALIASAALMVHRARQVRPAVILGIFQILFLLDPTHELARIALQTSRPVGMTVLFLWAAGVPVLSVLLLRALKLCVTAETILAPFAAAAGIAAGPILLDENLLRPEVMFLLLTAYGCALSAWMVRRLPRLEPSEGRCLGWARTVRDRVIRAMALAWVFSYFIHLVSWSFIFDVFPAYGILMLAALTVLAAARAEASAWCAVAAILFVGGARPGAFGPVVLTAAAVLMIRYLTGSNRRVLVGAAVLGWFGGAFCGWTGGGFPLAPLLLTAAAVGALVILAVRFRWPAALLPAAPLLMLTRWPSARLGQTGRGILLFASGFLLLAVGLIVNLWLGKRLKERAVSSYEDAPPSP